LMPPGALLRADFEVVPFLYRIRELAELKKWCNAKPWFGLRLYTGAGGMGKTRLALELCEKLVEEHWRAGILDLTFWR